jgi:hypothetical protein
MPADLITLEELKIALGASLTEVDDLKDKKLAKAISAASVAVRRFADRSFGLPLVAGSRIYEYDSSGFVDIDDAGEVSSVVFIFGGLEMPITNFYWRPEPQEGPPYTYLAIPHWAGVYSPQMGFTKNLDVIAKDRGWPGLIPTVKVFGKFGWPEVPDDVRQATIWTAAKFQEKPDQLVAESIANYSYLSQNRGSGPPPAIPPDAQDILAAYVRFQV